MTKKIFTSVVLLFTVFCSNLIAQTSIGGGDFSFLKPKKYSIAAITVDGTTNYDGNQIVQRCGLKVNQAIQLPGEEITKAMKAVWDLGFFSDVQIYADKIQGNTVFLRIQVKERERLTLYNFKGVSKSEADNLRDALQLKSGMVITENLTNKIEVTSKNYFIEKGFYNVKVDVIKKLDSLANGAKITIDVKKGEKVKIYNISISGNNDIAEAKLRRSMKKTKQKTWWRFWSRSKFMQSQYETDKKNLLNKYYDKAYRDARIVHDTVYFTPDYKGLNIEIKLDEGNKYYLRNITWVGNTKYRNGQLDTIVGLKKGEEYRRDLIDQRLFMNPAGTDVSSLYMDDGYLFFQLTPIEKNVENDSVDLELIIYEGKQARIRNITVTGNTKTNDHVIIREIRTKPGDLFNRNNIIRTQRELAQLGYFNPEALNVIPKPNPTDGTVDIEYVVEERPSDQVELSGGWGGGFVVGTLGLSFNNFSINRVFKKGSWSPLPAGDGQRLSLRAQSNGRFFQSYNMSFTEPWLGGKKPNSFSVMGYKSIQSNGVKRSDDRRTGIDITGVSLGLGKRLSWPDDFFTVYYELSYQYYSLQNFGSVFSFANGYSNNLSFRYALSRSSIDQPIYPRTGSQLTLSIKTTAPYSYFDGRNNYEDLTDQERYLWLEYNKIKFTTSWFTPLSKDRKLVLNTRFGFGYLNAWSKAKGPSPFERFYLGGSGLTGFNLDGREIIALRGYGDNEVSPQTGGLLINKYTAEVRYPLSLNPNATVFLLGFAEAGNTWNSYKEYNPFRVKRSAGVGVRIFLPMFGLLGLDYGWGFDYLDQGAFNPNYLPTGKGGAGQFHFTIGMNLGEL
ncbi:MAG: outer membrane protein assembly factor BamA [Flavobacteriales bacterium]